MDVLEKNWLLWKFDNKTANDDTFETFTLIFFLRYKNFYKFKSPKTKGLLSKNIELHFNIRSKNWQLFNV